MTDIREHFALDRATTVRIAEGLGVQHPRNSKTYLVMTTDFVVDLVRNGRITTMARMVKSKKALDNQRTLEKLEIDKRFWIEEGVDWGLVTNADIPHIAVHNIRWLRESVFQLRQYDPVYLEDLAARVLYELPASSATNLGQFCTQMDVRLSAQSGTALMIMRHLLAQKRVVCPMHDEQIGPALALGRFRIAGKASDA